MALDWTYPSGGFGRMDIELVTIHIVEDDPGVCDALSLLLRQIGHETIVYGNAESFFGAIPPDANDTVIIDLGLPGVNGVQVMRWLNRLTSRPKIIAITGQSQAAITQLLGGERPAILLRKPLNEKSLIEHL